MATVTDPSAAPVSRQQPADRWGIHRIWIAGALAAMLGGSRWVLGFWSLGTPSSPRGVFEDSQVLLLLALAGVVVGLSIAAAVAVWRRHFRRATSSVAAIAAIPICFLIVTRVPLFDPWLWYAIVHRSRFEALAANAAASNEPKYAVIEWRDVSTGLVIEPNHFVALIYDESDALALEPSQRPRIWRSRTEFGSPLPKGRRLFGHFFRVDVYV